MNILKNYKSMIILLVSIIIGGIIGVYFKDVADMISPLGTLFLNLLFTILVPFIFFSITSSIVSIENTKKVGTILRNIILVFFVSGIIISILTLPVSLLFSKTTNLDEGNFSSFIDESASIDELETTNYLDKFVSMISVDDFSKLITRDNMLQLVLVSLIIGIAISKLSSNKTLKSFIIESNSLMNKLMDYIMYIAPIGLGAYFASVIKDLGENLVGVYVSSLIFYVIACLVCILVYYTITAYIWKKNKGIKTFYKNAINPVLVATATCSSSASLPANINAASKMGVKKDIYAPTMSLGVSLERHGSIIGLVFKAVLLFAIFDPTKLSDPITLLLILLVSIISSLLIAAIPSGGVFAEMLIISLFGFNPYTLGIIAIFAIIIDIPATIVNVLGDISSCMLVEKITEE